MTANTTGTDVILIAAAMGAAATIATPFIVHFVNDWRRRRSDRQNNCNKPGHLEQNGRHERMHLTLKKEATKPASFNFLQQQERFDHFINVYNNERPHQALNGAYPGDVYTPSARVYKPPSEPEYPFHDRSVRVTRCGRICLGKRKISLSRVFAGQMVGIREVDNEIWLVAPLSSAPRARRRVAGVGRSRGARGDTRTTESLHSDSG